MQEEFDEVIHDYIDFVNEQVGMYMDALAGFAGNSARVERQISRIQRASGKNVDIITWASYEDPKEPDIIHNRIIKTADYIAANSREGSNEQQHSCAIIVFLYTYWELETRPRLAKIKNVEINEIHSNIMGDLRQIRNAILHKKRILKHEDYEKLQFINGMFEPNQQIIFTYEKMHKIFGMIKQGAAEMLLTYIGVQKPPFDIRDVFDVAIQKIKS